MIDHAAVQLAVRARVLGLAVCSTGAQALSATATGYARAAGSFVSDGFQVGMELAGLGFAAAANNAPKTVDAVSALALTCAGCVAEAVGTRTLSVGLPALRAWENVMFGEQPKRVHVEEDYLPGPAAMSTLSPYGRIVATPMYVLKIYGLSNRGIGALAAYATALMNLFPPGFTIPLASGDTLRVRADEAPYRGQLMQDLPGWAVVPVTIPLRLYTLNSI